MKRITILLFILIGGISLVAARDGSHQQLSPEEFRKQQQAFITDKAELTSSEATLFFPVYFELQDKKKNLNDKAWKLLQKGKDEKTTDDEYEKIMLDVYDLRIESYKLEKSYYDKFKKILSPKKIYMVQRAETRFHRELVKGIHKKGNNQPDAQQQRGKRK